MQLSCDVVHKSNSNSVSIDVYSSCFKNCKNIYPHRLVRPLGKFKVKHNEQLGTVLNDLTSNELKITQFIGDNLKRAIAKMSLNHAAWYPCEYCYAKGSKIDIIDRHAQQKLISQKNIVQEKINDCEKEPQTPENVEKIANLNNLKNELQKSIDSMKKKSNIVWPFSTFHSEHRSRQSLLDILNLIETEPNLTIDQLKGVVGRSLLMDIPWFNFVYDTPAEYMHSGCLGVIKKLVELTFSVGVNRERITKRKLSPPKKFNELMAKIKLPHESSRRARDLDLAVFKAQEYRNVCIFFFPLVTQCIEKDAKERHLWLYLAYMIRSSIIPSEEFEPLNVNEIEQVCEKYYKLYEELFGQKNTTYNTHVFVAHLLEIRTHGPLTETSAFKFESFYSEMRRSFVPGTTSGMKQIMQNVLMKRALGNHCCKNSILFSNYDTALECNKFIYLYDQNEYSLFEIDSIEGNTLTCFKIGQYPASFPETPEINWSLVGVFKQGAKSNQPTSIQTSEPKGKVIIVGDLMITCPNNILNEK